MHIDSMATRGTTRSLKVDAASGRNRITNLPFGKTRVSVSSTLFRVIHASLAPITPTSISLYPPWPGTTPLLAAHDNLWNLDPGLEAVGYSRIGGWIFLDRT